MRSDNYPNKSTETLLYSETDSRTLKYWDDFASKERLCYSTMYYWGTMPAQGETMLSSSCTMGDYACPGRNYALEFMSGLSAEPVLPVLEQVEPENNRLTSLEQAD